MRPSPPHPPHTNTCTHTKTRTHTQAHTLMLSCTLGPHALSRAGSCSPVERHRARGGGMGGAVGGGGEVLRGREAARWRGGGGRGAALGGQWQCSQACRRASRSPVSLEFLSLLPPPFFSLCVWIGPPRLLQGSLMDR